MQIRQRTFKSINYIKLDQLDKQGLYFFPQNLETSNVSHAFVQL